VDSLEIRFALIPEKVDQRWTNILIDLVTVGTPSAAGPFFDSVLKKTTYFAAKEDTFDNFKDTTMNLSGQGTILAKEMYNDNKDRSGPQGCKNCAPLR
jgi:hypothetical protein